MMYILELLESKEKDNQVVGDTKSSQSSLSQHFRTQTGLPDQAVH